MSHYAVAVFHKEDQDYEELLAPYDENLPVEPYLDLTKEEAIKRSKKLWSQIKEYSNYTDEQFYDLIAEEYEIKDKDGNLYSTYNPDSKWDWWTEGGRWDGYILLKNGESVNSAHIKDINFNVDTETYKQALRYWDVVVEHMPKDNEEEMFSIYTDEYYEKYYGTKENYAEIQATFNTRVVITPDGQWHEVGEMGWFGSSSEDEYDFRKWYAEYRERFIDGADPNWIITIVDCHI